MHSCGASPVVLTFFAKCVQVAGGGPTARLHDLRPSDLWAWTSFTDYMVFLLCYALLLAFLGAAFASHTLYTSTLGTIALVTEARYECPCDTLICAHGRPVSLALPQILRNHKQRSTQGLSVKMVAGWTLGDSFKLVVGARSACFACLLPAWRVCVQYFVCRPRVPLQFLVCAGVQLALDGIVFWQIAMYRPLGVC